jgi:hypothetical protein
MEVLGLLRVLWRRRLLVLVGAAAAVALGVAVGGTPSTSSGFAHARVLVDTPRSQLVDTAPIGADTLTWRASLMAHLIAGEPAKERLARRLGIRPDELAVVDPALSAPQIGSSLPKSASELAGMTAVPYVLTVYLQNTTLPVISVEAVAPDREAAARLAAAAEEVLKADVPPPQPEPAVTDEEAESDAFRSDLSELQPFVVREVGSVRARTVVTGGLPMKAVAAAIVVFGLWTMAVAFLPLVARLLRDHRRVQPT